jgi:hypothetical protein
MTQHRELSEVSSLLDAALRNPGFRWNISCIEDGKTNGMDGYYGGTKPRLLLAGRLGSKAKRDELMTSATLEVMAGETHRRTSTQGLLRNT